MEHVHGILLEGEDSRVVKYTEQCHEPEAAGGEYLSKVPDAERVILLLSLACLCVELAVHDEIDDGHDECDTHEYHAEGNAAADADNTTQTCEEW